MTILAHHNSDRAASPIAPGTAGAAGALVVVGRLPQQRAAALCAAPRTPHGRAGRRLSGACPAPAACGRAGSSERAGTTFVINVAGRRVH